MKTLLGIALTLGTLTGFAATIQVLETHANQNYVGSTFAVNEQLGRAWVEVALQDNFGTEPTTGYERAKVEGLSLVGDTVVLNVEGQQVECAKVRTVGRIFSRREVKATGNCTFKTAKGSKTCDDGFEVTVVKTLIVNLVTK